MNKLINALNTPNTYICLEDINNLKKITIKNLNVENFTEIILTNSEFLLIYATIFNKLISINPFILNQQISTAKFLDDANKIKYIYHYLPAYPSGQSIIIQILEI